MNSELYPLQNVKTIRELKTVVSSIYENLENRSGELTPGTKLKKTNLSVGIATLLDLQEVSSDLHSEVSSVGSDLSAISSDLVDSLSNVVIPKLDVIGNLISAQSEQIAAKADLSSLATVATTGSYNDLSDLPTIPEANNGVLTIQRNGTALTSFSANQSSDISVNIVVPTKTSDLTNDSNFVASTALTAYVPKTTTINGQQLAGDIVLNAASVSAATEAFVLENITQGTAIYRGSYATKAALNSIAWQTSDPTAQYYVSNNDYAVVQDDESNNYECWRYIYVTENGTGWTAQYMINESPLTNAQLSALNSGATSEIIASVASKVSAIAMNDSAIAPTNGVVDLGTVLTAHQSLESYVLTSTNSALSTKVATVEASLTSKADVSSLEEYLPLSGGALSGSVYFGNSYLDPSDGTICDEEGIKIDLINSSLVDPTDAKRWTTYVVRDYYPDGEPQPETIATLVDLSSKADLSAKNFLDYATVSALTLSSAIDVYKMTLTKDGVSADFPAIDPTSIPVRDSYFKFELEITVPTGVTTITYPSCYEWLNEDDIPEPGLVEGRTIYIAARFDCNSDRNDLGGSTLVNVWRIK